MTKLASFTILVASTVVACRAGPGEGCEQKDDCREGLVCHEKSCRTQQEVAKIQYDRGEAAWRETRADVVGKIGHLHQRMDELEKRLSGAKSEAEREQIREELRKLRQTPGIETDGAAAPTPSP